MYKRQNLYFGSRDKFVYRAFGDGSQSTDQSNVGLGRSIEGFVQSSFHHFGSRESKIYKNIRVLLESTGNVSFGVGTKVDYDSTPPVSITRASQFLVGSDWDVAEWDVSEWATEFVQVRPWKPVDAQGAALSYDVSTSTKGVEVKLHGADVRFEPQTNVL